MYQPYVELVMKELHSKGERNFPLKEVLRAVWNNPVITSVCPDLVIRLTSLRGEVSKRLWEQLGNNPDEIQILAVGTTAIPTHLTSYRNALKNFWEKTAALAAEYREDNNYQIGYDLLSKGSKNATGPVLDLFNEHFGFKPEQIAAMRESVAIISGGMRGLKDLASALVLSSKSANTFHRFIQPDNSFGTWWNIIELPVTKPNDPQRRIHTITAKPENKLHLTKEDVEQFYKENAPHTHESWYITPVGNPSGTSMTGEQLTKVCESIIAHNPQATIILDTVYIRTLPKPAAKHLMEGVIANEAVMANTMFLESFSKSHGLCRERLGCYFSSNPLLFRKLHAANIAFSAGPGQYKDFQFQALGEMSEEDKEGISSLHEFWRQERKGLYRYLLEDRYAHLFEREQKHITQQDLDATNGLYILLKTCPGIKAQQVFENTGVLGVDTALQSGHYIRFAVGTLKKPTYSNDQ